MLCAIMPLSACACLQHNVTAGVVTVVSGQKWTSKNRSHAGSVTVLHKVTTLKGRLAKFKLDIFFVFYEQGYKTFRGVTYLWICHWQQIYTFDKLTFILFCLCAHLDRHGLKLFTLSTLRTSETWSTCWKLTGTYIMFDESCVSWRENIIAE